jgi:peptidoglycan/LPS O-acetylase OafA/YrhL
MIHEITLQEAKSDRRLDPVMYAPSGRFVADPAVRASVARMPGIDVLRGFAVFLVVLHHIHLRFLIQRYDVATLFPSAVSDVLFRSGYFAVVTFFVISGFLITTLSLRRWGSLASVPVGAFYRLRAARVLPCLILLLGVLSILHLAQVTGFTILPERASLGRALMAGLAFHVNWLEGHRGYLPGSWDVLWSLSIEETFYLLFPVLCITVRRERWLFWPMIALIVFGPFNRVRLAGQEPWAEYHWLSGMDGIAIGCLAAWLSIRRPPGQNALRAMAAFGGALVLLIIVLRPLGAALGLGAVGLDVTFLELGVALTLVAMAGGVGQRAFATGTGLLRLMGRCSYEIYLTHMFVILGLMPVFRSLFSAAHVAQWHFLASYAVMLALSVFLGWLVATVFSEPLNKFFRSK